MKLNTNVGQKISRLAKGLNQPESIVKLAFKGPKPNVDMASIGAIRSGADARRLLKQAKSMARCREIVRRWIEVAEGMYGLPYVFSEMQSMGLYHDTELRALWHAKWEEIVNARIPEGHWEILYELRKRCHGEFLRDRVTVALYNICSSVDRAMEVVHDLEQVGRLDSDSSKTERFEFWLFLGKAAEFATPEEAVKILRELTENRRFDPAQPACISLVQKALEYYR